jgi:DNA-binding CsgD family transcriptional regulator
VASPIFGRSPASSLAEATQRLENKDVAGLLHLMAELACARNDPRRWRMEALEAMTRMLPAAAAASFIVKLKHDPAANTLPAVISLFDLGFKGSAEHEAFINEFNQAAFQDPLSKRVLENVRTSEHPSLTVARRDLVDDGEWYGSPGVERFRRTARVDDCLMSVQRWGGADAEGAVQVMVLLAFRAWGDPAPFTVRDRLWLDALHQGLEWMYRAEETLQRVTRATALSPRLRQTLDFLLAGDTERQVAGRMGISIHTVHDYVKALYLHFGVSSRGELMARWIQSGEVLPVIRREEKGNQ